MKQLLSGNEAIARGLYEAGAEFASAYPGTPSTEVLENLVQYKDDIYAEWAPNEKVATEVAYGASMAGARSFCTMKMVGANVAADPLFTAAYQGVNGGFIFMSADDPSMHSSQNEQDNRHYARHAKIAMVEPSDSQECKDFVKMAYELSEKFDTPVLYRVTTRIDHSKSLVEFGEREEHKIEDYVKNPRKNVCTPANAYMNHPIVEKRIADLAEYGNDCPFNKVEMNGTKMGVITAGISYQYAKEAFPEDTSFLKLGLTYPLPMKLIREFADKVDELYVIEELDPFMEDQIKAAGIACKGKEFTGEKYELNAQLIEERVFGKTPEIKEVAAKAVMRPPALCPGCPHRGFFYTMAKGKNYVVTADIGCYTLGCAQPLNAIDSVLCMGGGFTVGMGMSKVFERTGADKKVFGVVGDSTFFHSGITGLAEIAYNKGNVIPVVLDNGITGMTGQQENPGSGYTLEGEIANNIKVEEIMKACGFVNVFTVDPQDLKAMQEAVDGALASEEPAAIIAKRECRLLKRAAKPDGVCIVDADKCVGCRACLKVGCPAVSFKDGKSVIDQTQCVGCTVCMQVCPVEAIVKEAR